MATGARAKDPLFGKNVRETVSAIRGLFSSSEVSEQFTEEKLEEISERAFPESLEAPMPSETTEGANSLKP